MSAVVLHFPAPAEPARPFSRRRERPENKLFPSGRGAARQARLVWVQEVVSSNLAAPTPTIFSLATLSIRRRLRRSLKMQIHPRAPEA